MPAYRVPEAAHYLGLPETTVRYWSAARDSYESLITAAAEDTLVLSFFNLVELHLLAAIRRKHAVSMPNVRRAIGCPSDRIGPVIHDAPFIAGHHTGWEDHAIPSVTRLARRKTDSTNAQYPSLYSSENDFGNWGAAKVS